MEPRPPFPVAAQRVMKEIGLSASSPADLVRRWESLVEECEAGYTWDISEYDNELRARKALGHLLGAVELQPYPELAELAEVVGEIDRRFRRLLQDEAKRPGKTTWYEKGVLRRAGQQYVDYFQSAFEIPVELAEP